MVNVNKAARGKHRWVGFQTSEEEFSRAKCEDILSIILPNINWRLFDLKTVNGVFKGILKIPLEEYDFTLIAINNEDSLETLTSSGKIRLVRERLALK
ncbi:hypothetical protein OAV46_01535 [Euryarchaeota archaeon]|nr:hypothetical protein [Candidatus Thalassarchaeum sp.]MDB3854823.1 hypothetical protein [Euryarchaeota archaeon]MDC3281698.1 hypothetical protein [Euryarchaeota archaeon]